ncbi:thioesterase [Acrocarpospora phusangensis]|uniref:Thioesterase n=1 Tax=Acrocarpospora phusangensis TaxID=1070424 RepID=A0A919UKR3_9ACTN|nr:alpha/beta fold hydrolase [Acrocarpospora phusangensis]GIH25279.1 thioesterase [Acrocarpospora phusangensis]
MSSLSVLEPVRLLAPGSTSAMRLVCFPYAGGGLSVYRALRPSAGVEVLGVQLPGREDRYHESPFQRMSELVDWLCAILPPYLDRPTAFFGHSMGARVALALTRRLSADGGPSPRALFVSGSPGPCLNTTVGGWNEPDDGLISWLRRMDGTPREILERPEILNALLPTLRADLTVVATHPYHDGEPLSIPIHAFAGEDDDYAGPDRMAYWRRETTGRFQLSPLPGGHFFLTSQLPAILTALDRDLTDLTGELSRETTR